jgi:hypothetical protein
MPKVFGSTEGVFCEGDAKVFQSLFTNIIAAKAPEADTFRKSLLDVFVFMAMKIKFI